MSSSSSSNDNSDNSQFLTSGSSALILSFLAIGLFVAGLLVMFAMRRYVFLSRRRAGRWTTETNGPWNWTEQTYDVPSPFAVDMGVVRRRKEIGVRPELYDLHVVRAAGTNWAQIMPMTAQLGVLAQPPCQAAKVPGLHDMGQSQHPAAMPGYLYPFSVGVRDFVAQIRPPPRHPRPRSPSPPPPFFSPLVSAPRNSGHTPAPPYADNAVATAEPSQLRVALAILMPGQQACQPDVPLYALGVADVRWSGGTLDDLRREEG
ncbi:hypothetical protein BD414DRAFT_423942 [Trametes punicea]|nr:hypothetical protein BD414DRAFT_423942 [Trametes punicea]